MSLYDLAIQGIATRLGADSAIMSDAHKLRTSAAFDDAAAQSYLGPTVILDSSGHVAAASVDDPPSSFDQMALDRVFAQAKATTKPALMITRPFRLQPNGPLLIGLGRRVRNADGTLGGIVLGTLRCDYFHALFPSMNLGGHAVFSLLSEDGTDVMWEASDSRQTREPITPAELSGRVAKVDRGDFQTVSTLDGHTSLVHFQRIDRLAMVLVVTLSTEEIDAGWWRKAIFMGSFLLVCCVTIAWLAMASRKRNETQLKAAHSRAEASAATNAAILGQLAESVIVTDAAGRISFVNDAAATIHGVVRLDVEPHAYSETYHLYTEDGQPYVPHELPLARAVRGETVSDARWRIRRPDASEVLAIGSAQPLRGADGRQIGAVLTLRDDTAREAAERSLRESEARLRTLTDNMPSGIIFQLVTKADSLERRFLYLSRSFERITGVPAEAALADANVAYGLIVPEYRRALVTAEAVAARAGAPLDVEIQVKRANTGEVRWSRIISAAREMPDGSLIWDGLQIDITDQKRAEEALRELNATLTERVVERTRDADASRAQAEAASQAKSEFLATMSHEIRTPLSGVLGYTDLILEEPSIGASVRLHGERIRSAGSALLTIVNDVLDFSKIEAGHIELNPEPFSPVQLLEDAMSIVRPSAERKGLDIRIEAAAQLPLQVVGDRDRLRQVLLNLLNNAIKFTHSGSVALIVEVLAVDHTRAQLRFLVTDTGIGIPTSKRHLLFERFSQVDGTIQRQFGGTGLGLAISKQLIDCMAGTIEVNSEVGAGSTFWFDVSLALATAVSYPFAAEPIVPTAHGRRLLLVEDVVLNQELARAVLETGGYLVDVVSSGAEAIEAVQAKAYELVLMDVQMPGIDGITATRLIRALSGPVASLPIVAMTANVMPHQVAALKAAGMQDHVGKPFRRDVLFSTIERWARGRDGTTASLLTATGPRSSFCA